jgi:16S rRNA (uracil1498-N3)-methyltransferase
MITLVADEAHHLRDVLRMKVGDEAAVFDGEGAEYNCRIEEIEKKTARLSIISPVEPTSPESPCEITLAASLLKSDKFDLVIQKAVELGVTHFLPVETVRSEAKAKYSEKRVIRWRRIALDAAKQCGRARLMTVGDIVLFDSFVKTDDSREARVLFSERGGDAFSSLTHQKRITAIIGPEGGWDDGEIELARSHGVEIVTLKGRILRAETAAITIAALLQHRFGDLN